MKRKSARVSEIEKCLTGFLDELKNVYCDNCEGVTPSEYVFNKTYIYDLIQKSEFHKKEKSVNYDNFKKYNNIVTLATRLLNYDFSPYKARRTASSAKLEAINFCFEREQVISMKDVKRYLKMV